ncbi:MAG: type II toxin-antitoxin system VapC family toxin [Gammaproteobacteria bacterium]|nr:type II toxin-antitoxin system VapC family toxin [Gammaproteobacteria bacterium]
MQLLLDTTIFLWWLKDDAQLSKKARTLIKNADIVYISSISIWEAAIKIQLGKLTADINQLVNAIPEQGFVAFPLLATQASIISSLPPIHRDPFDRMLIAQAISEPLRLLTSDKVLKNYSELVEIV